MTCPFCAADLGYRVVGVQVRFAFDGVLCWVCPDCDKAWPRFPEGPRHDMGADWAQAYNEK